MQRFLLLVALAILLVQHASGLALEKSATVAKAPAENLGEIYQTLQRQSAQVTQMLAEAAQVTSGVSAVKTEIAADAAELAQAELRMSTNARNAAQNGVLAVELKGETHQFFHTLDPAILSAKKMQKVLGSLTGATENLGEEVKVIEDKQAKLKAQVDATLPGLDNVNARVAKVEATAKRYKTQVDATLEAHIQQNLRTHFLAETQRVGALAKEQVATKGFDDPCMGQDT